MTMSLRGSTNWTPMNREIKFEGVSRAELALAGAPLSLADRIERFGRALTATQLATLLAVSRINIYKLAKKNRIPSFRIGTCVRFDPKAVAIWLRGQ
jgi:excisionase family DNA binding protein